MKDVEEVKKMMIAIQDIMADPKLVAAISNMAWNLFTALKKKGFTEEQAMIIVGNYSHQAK